MPGSCSQVFAETAVMARWAAVYIKTPVGGGIVPVPVQSKNVTHVLKGTSKDDVLTGSEQNERFQPGAGFDLMFGNGGRDRFVFKGRVDHDLILNFNVNDDKIVLHKTRGLHVFTDLKLVSLLCDNGNARHTRIEFDEDNSITLFAVRADMLESSNFIFIN